MNADKIDRTGDIMIDSFEMLRDGIESANTAAELGLDSGEYALVTLHRPSDVDAAESLTPIVDALIQAAESLPIVFVAHPRTIAYSGGLQEETTYLGIPCLTLRENIERPVTVSMGTNKLVDAGSQAENLQTVLDGSWHKGKCPPLWDGKTAARAVQFLAQRIENRPT